MVIILVLLITETRITSFGLRLLRVCVYLFWRAGCYTVGFKLPEGPDNKCFVVFLDFHFKSNKRIARTNQNS